MTTARPGPTCTARSAPPGAGAAVLSVCASLWPMPGLSLETWRRSATWMALRSVVCSGYGRSHSGLEPGVNRGAEPMVERRER